MTWRGSAIILFVLLQACSQDDKQQVLELPEVSGDSRSVAGSYTVVTSDGLGIACMQQASAKGVQVSTVPNGGKVMLVSPQQNAVINEQGYWLKVHADGATATTCYVKADDLVPVPDF